MFRNEEAAKPVSEKYFYSILKLNQREKNDFQFQYFNTDYTIGKRSRKLNNKITRSAVVIFSARDHAQHDHHVFKNYRDAREIIYFTRRILCLMVPTSRLNRVCEFYSSFFTVLV